MKNYLFTLVCVLLVVTGCKGQPQARVDTSLITHKVLSDSARILEARGDTDRALHYHKRALMHARRHVLQEQEARTLMHIARLLKREDADQSLAHLDNALQIAERLHKHDLKADILLAKAGIYKQQQNYHEALATLEAHQRLLQQVFNKNKAQEIARLQENDDQQRERAIFITILTALALLAGVFAFYYRRTKRLNNALYESNQIKNKLFSIIGHDLRGPAGGIMQALEMIDAGLLDEQEEKEVIRLLKQQSQAFNETLNTLLNWAAAQLKGTEPHIASVDAMIAIRKTLDLLMAQAMAKNIHITAQQDGGLPVMADSDQLDFVVRNLVSNAIKFSFPGGQIDITAKKQKHEAIIAVHDNGKGIPKEKQAQLFAEGRLTSTFGTKGEKGTGLGLMLSWDFIRANNGRIWFDSREGAGTTFYVSLPLADG